MFPSLRTRTRIVAVALGAVALGALMFAAMLAAVGSPAFAQDATGMPAAPVRPADPSAPTLATTPRDFALPGTQPGGLTTPLLASNSCGFCHVPELIDDFSGSMMANAARDPIFRAALAVANQDAAGSGELCLRCHTPNGFLNGRATPSDGSTLVKQDLQGVSCSFCHRLVAPVALPGEAPTDAAERSHITTTLGIPLMAGSGAYVVDRSDIRRGPLSAEGAPHAAAQSTQLRAATLCETCHDIDNPTLRFNETTQAYELNALDTPAAATDRLFPLERTYSEWDHSAFNPAGGGVQELSATYPGIKRATLTEAGPVTVCQDCHMPMIEAPIVSDGEVRTLGQHQFAGGSAQWQKGIASFWSGVPGDTLFDAGVITNSVALGEAMLGRAATLEVTFDGPAMAVKIINNTGHKLPTGYAEGRRMWLEVLAWDATDALVFASGVPTATGAIDNPQRIYEIRQGVSAEHAQALGRPSLAGEGFHFILNNKVFKDNRIPPRGWNEAGFTARDILPVGAAYVEGQYWDVNAYVLPAGAVRVQVRLLYQSVSDEYLDFLAEEANVAVDDAVVGAPVNWGATVAGLRTQLGLDAPVTMTSVTRITPAGLTERVYLPSVEE